MLPEPVVLPPPCSLPARHRATIERALRPLGTDVEVLLHRVAVVDGRLVGYDAWYARGAGGPLSANAAAQEGLTDRDIRRMSRRQRNRFAPSARGDHFDAWFFEGRRALGRARVRCTGPVSAARLKSLAKSLAQAWRAVDGATREPPLQGTVFADAHGALIGWDEGAARALELVPGLKRIVGGLVSQDRAPARVLHDGLEILGRPLLGPGAAWAIELKATVCVELSPDADLTPTQRTVAEYAVVGATVDEIATTLSSGKETVRSHLREIYRRLEVANRVELVRALDQA